MINRQRTAYNTSPAGDVKIQITSTTNRPRPHRVQRAQLDDMQLDEDRPTRKFKLPRYAKKRG